MNIEELKKDIFKPRFVVPCASGNIEDWKSEAKIFGGKLKKAGAIIVDGEVFVDIQYCDGRLFGDNLPGRELILTISDNFTWMDVTRFWNLSDIKINGKTLLIWLPRYLMSIT